MAYPYIKFPKKFLSSEEWLKPRKFSKAEALLFVLNEPYKYSIGQLAVKFQWSKSTVHDFIKEITKQGFAERLPNDLPNDCRTANNRNNSTLQQSAERLPNDLPNDCRTHLNKNNNITPQVLSTTNVVSNTIPPKGEERFLQEVSEDFRGIVKDFFAYKRERQESYKTHRSMQAFYTRLKKISQDNPVIAREIIEQSMANNWAGIFPLKTTKQYEQQSATDSAGNAEPDEIYRIVAEGIARAHTPQEWESRAVGL